MGSARKQTSFGFGDTNSGGATTHDDVASNDNSRSTNSAPQLAGRRVPHRANTANSVTTIFMSCPISHKSSAGDSYPTKDGQRVNRGGAFGSSLY
jgi:hypothetical protein